MPFLLQPSQEYLICHQTSAHQAAQAAQEDLEALADPEDQEDQADPVAQEDQVSRQNNWYL